jgi:hypothetical protein
MRGLRALLFGALIARASALRAADAGVIDWHTPLAGVPLTQWAHTAPSLHGFRTGVEPNALVVTATASNVLAAIHPENGTLGASAFSFE